MSADAVMSMSDDATAAHATPTERADWLTRELALLCALIALLGAQVPLLDPDLPMHLALGEWIVRHGAVPFQEPFAWTRAGAPFYAYSWLPEIVFYGVHATFGPVGLRVLQGLLVGGVFGSIGFLGWSMRWRSSTTLLLGGVGILVSGLVVPALRPQILIAILLPVIWGLCWRAVHEDRLGWTPLWLLLASAVLANSHLFFVLSAGPLALFWIRDRWDWRRVAICAAAIVGGWLLCPYALVWPAVLKTNLGYNAMIDFPSPIGELKPGFLTLHEFFGLRLVPVLAILLSPWVLGRRRMTWREQAGAAAFWLVGLVVFAQAVRMLLVWWVLFLPFLAWAVETVVPDDAEAPPPRRRFRYGGYAGLLAAALFAAWQQRTEWNREGTVETRTLATEPARPSERIAGWAEAQLRPEARGNLYTIFNFGSYLTWRLPMLSSSIDGRGIFPDSVAKEQSFRLGAGDLTPTLWRSADLAILPTGLPAARALDTASTWRRIAVSYPVAGPGDPPPSDSVALWVRLDWWARAGREPVPAVPAVLPDSMP